jgi:hypothetical protein
VCTGLPLVKHGSEGLYAVLRQTNVHLVWRVRSAISL